MISIQNVVERWALSLASGRAESTAPRARRRFQPTVDCLGKRIAPAVLILPPGDGEDPSGIYGPSPDDGF